MTPARRTYASPKAKARAIILRAANRGSYHAAMGRPYRMAHLNAAVCRVRRLGLVPDRVLVTAGFNPRKVTR